ncbi:MAG TPA: flavin oxidoreductase/NADH oxidase [Ruminococcaceae bacterium]|nr:flavin oxidoreductase/NADH oxidase [Oscillospiraceae bacterium]
MVHERFTYHTLDEVRERSKTMKITLPLSDDLSVLGSRFTVGKTVFQNRLAIQPMEGCDGTSDGRPGELSIRRYHRFARSGAGLIWAEATAVCPEGRANPRQWMLTDDNLDDYRRLVEDIRRIAQTETGIDPVLVLQLTHSGRYSKPDGIPAPLIARNNPLFETANPIDDDRIVSDEYLSRLPEAFARSARLADQAGFDGVDIKACHGYLMNELLAAHTRPGQYGGSFENRTRLFVDCCQAAKSATDAFVTSRMSIYDGFPLPYGWGADADGNPDLAEPLELIRWFHEKSGLSLLDITIGNPYVNPHVNRPYDNGPYMPPEHPLEGVARMCDCISQVKRQFPSLSVVCSGMSYLRGFSGNLAAGMIDSGAADIAGFGRMAFAYPDFARDLLKGSFDPKRSCIACGKCSEMMRAGSVAGCVIRDKDVYLPLYQGSVKGSAAK